MFELKKYKNFAKTQLSSRWGVPVVVSLFELFILKVFSFPNVLQLYQNGYFTAFLHLDYVGMTTAAEASNTPLLFSLIQCCVNAILSVASINLYLKMSRSPEPVSFSDFIEGFNNWARAILSVLWQLLCVTSWTLLFIIPGIIKAIAYSQMFYIIVEYKNVSITKAMRISMEITKGHKCDLFVMYLSFLGWDILAFLTLGFLNLWLLPYKNMTYINAYHSLVKEAIESGRLKPEDFTE